MVTGVYPTDALIAARYCRLAAPAAHPAIRAALLRAADSLDSLDLAESLDLSPRSLTEAAGPPPTPAPSLPVGPRHRFERAEPLGLAFGGSA